MGVAAGSRGPKRSRKASFGLHSMLLGALFVALFPMAWLVLSSFKRKDDINSPDLQVLPPHWTLDNYDRVLTGNDGEFLKWLLNSSIVALCTTLLALLLSATAAYALSRYRFPGYRPALTSFLVTQMFPGAILVVPIFSIMVSLGLLDSKLALILAYSTVAVPFCVWMLKGYFDTIPISIEEAARVDGLTPFGTFWRIVVPLSVPGIAVTAFYSFITAWNEVLFANVLLVDNDSYTLPLGLRTYVNQFEINYELLSAGAVLVTIPAVLVFLFAQRYLVAGLTRGGVKG